MSFATETKLVVTAFLMLITAASVSPAAGADRDKLPFPTIQVPGHVRNEAAIKALGDRLPEVAAWYGKTAREMERLLRHDRTLWVDRSGHLMYECELEEPLSAGADAAGNSGAASVGVTR